MKLTFLFILINSISFCQKWSYQGHDKKEKYGHVYCFSFQNEEDTNSLNYSYSNLIDSNNVTVAFMDNNGKAIPFANFEIRTDFSDEYIIVNTGIDGEYSMSINCGEIEITAKNLQYDDFQTVLELDSNQKLNLTIMLGLAPELQIYQINSRKKIPDSEKESLLLSLKLTRCVID